jgi:hypothetical protein
MNHVHDDEVARAEDKLSPSNLGRFIHKRKTELGLTLQNIADRLETKGFKYTAAGVGHWTDNSGKYPPPIGDPGVCGGSG